MNSMEELTKEVFAWFGAAYHSSEVFYRGLCNIYALATFDQVEHITRPRVEEKLSIAFSWTLGQLLDKTRSLLPSELQEQLEIALGKRNYLAHHFWYVHNNLMFDELGLLELRQELIELASMFGELDEKLTVWFKPKRQAMGLTDELLQESFDQLVNGEPDEPLIAQRPLKKQERVIAVWDVKVNNDLITQIFETEDGCLWQFCDVGLGWTRLNKSDLDWTTNERLQKYLPANVNPRPRVIEPWNYELILANRAVLWVERGKHEKSYRWGIRV